MTPEIVKVLVNLTADLVAKIDDFRFEHRLLSRSEAIRQLIELGLKNPPEVPKKITKK